jgi:hypothetical protein
MIFKEYLKQKNQHRPMKAFKKFLEIQKSSPNW